MPQSFHITTSTLFRFVGIILGLFLLYFLGDIVLALVFAVIIASALEPAIEWLKKRRIPRIASVVLLYGVIALFFAAMVYLIFPLISEELRTVSFSFPLIQEELFRELSRFGELPFSSFFTEGSQLLFDAPEKFLQQLGGGVFNVASLFFGGIVSFVLIVVFSFYLATQEQGIENFLRLITPLKYETYALDVWQRSQKKLGYWVRAQILLGVLVGMLIFLGLTFLNVQYALLFALLAAVFEVIPVVGPILAAVPAVVTSFLVSPALGLFTVILYIAVQQIESSVIVPVVMKRAVGLSPLIVVLALVVGAKLGGILGILLAVPLTAIGAEFLNDWDKKKRALMPG